MPLFRNSLDLTRAITRPAAPADLSGISRLLSRSRYHLLNFPSERLPSLISDAPVIVLSAGNEIWAVAIGSAPLEGTAWLRGLALADGLPIERGLGMLLPAFHSLAQTWGVKRLYYGGDMSSDVWLQPRLTTYGYLHDTYVITYSKTMIDAPASGNQAIQLRRGQDSDLKSILAIDHASFEPQWHKDETALHPALAETPYFVVAELNAHIAGYAFAATYFEGRQVHLVRIAVLPEDRGQGIGVRLMADIVDFARSCKAHVITLNTQEYNTHARQLYEWFGFRLTGERQLILHRDL